MQRGSRGSQARKSQNAGKKEEKMWDMFRSKETEVKSASDRHTYTTAYSILKLVTMLFCFFIMLGSGLVIKGCTFLAVSQLAVTPKPMEYCRDNYPASSQVGGPITCTPTAQSRIAWMWTLFFAFCLPEIFSFLKAAQTVLMKSYGRAPFHEILIVLTFEVLHVIGLAILFLIAFPGMDTIRGVMATNAVCLVPALLKLFSKQKLEIGRFWSRNPDQKGKKLSIPRVVTLVLTALAMLCQLAALFAWTFLPTIDYAWSLPVGLFLTSLGWWEVFVDKTSPSIFGKLWHIKARMQDGGSRAFTYLIVSVSKMATFLFSMMVIAATTDIVGEWRQLFWGLHDSFSSQYYYIYNNGVLLDTVREMESFHPMWVILTFIWTSLLGYHTAKFACRYSIQQTCFALPLTLVNLVAIVLLGVFCGVRAGNACVFSSGLPSNLFWTCPAGSDDPSNWIIGDYLGVLWFLWLFSQIWICFHIWMPTSMRLATTEQMFSKPLFNMLLFDQGLMLNRRADDGQDSNRFDFKAKHFNTEAETEEVDSFSKKSRNEQRRKKISTVKDPHGEFNVTEEDKVTRIYGCATMWHENDSEMTEMLKSIFRIDVDSLTRTMTRENTDSFKDPDYYEWETHIFFDDCMEISEKDKHEFIVNEYVRLLVEQVSECSKKYYGKRFQVECPVKIATPYGGRLIWTLPGQTKIICHLKDKKKIRHKKRWSQCMYMYYFLGYQLMDNPEMSQARKEVRAANTYLLALDGDVDFQPDAILKLVDLMKRNPEVGAACGRIHPIGSGYMQWYQMFEYAIGHWLQKATEHVMGCVLCSPGCFSLFRAKAVMDDNVMNKYTTKATEPRHYVQYDQGEDRWLCTLLLQQGWRVEYSAASDSFTACPEGFKEFYNQRRRWMPSTIANIADLLKDYQNVMKKNDDITFFYIIYQWMLMFGTILGPGSIFLMLVGAFNIAFGISNVDSLIVNAVIVVVFILVCFFASSDHQIMVAMVMSVAYAIIMMAVLVGIALQVKDDGLLAPTSLSLLFVAGSFILAAILHPQEFKCLPMGVIYYITIPSMYLLLMIYSIFNLNNVSWGTREAPKSEAEKAAEQEQKTNQDAKKVEEKSSGGLGGLLGYFQSKFESKKTGTLDFSFGNICSCLLFTRDDEADTKRELMVIADKLDKLERSLNIRPEITEMDIQSRRGSTFVRGSRKNSPLRAPSVSANSMAELLEAQERRKRDELVDPYWMENNEENKEKCPLLAKAPEEKLGEHEIQFWRDFIGKYLMPEKANRKEQEKISAGLKELRNQMVLSFLILNSIWIVTIFLLQQNKDTLYITWPFGPKGPNITWDTTLDYYEVDKITLEYEYLELEPLGLIFVIFFALVMLVQLVGMLLHRIMTLGHFVSTTKIRLFNRGDSNNIQTLLNEKGRQVIQEISDNIRNDDGTGTGANLGDCIRHELDQISKMDEATLTRLKTLKSVKGRKRREFANQMSRRYSRVGRNGPRNRHPDTIQEEDEADNVIPVVRTISTVDPEGLSHRQA